MPVLADKVFVNSEEKFIFDCSKELEEKIADFSQVNLDQAYERAHFIDYDKKRPLVIFSDCHRGIRQSTDPFTKNEDLYYYILDYYYNSGFTYLEAGDGDEMYKYPFDKIQNSYEKIFELLHKYNNQDRLIMVSGNHDLGTNKTNKTESVEKDGLTAHEAVVLENAQTGQQLFIVHGHQADMLSERYRPFGQAVVRYFLDPLFKMGLIGFNDQGDICCMGKRSMPAFILKCIEQSQDKIEKRIALWAGKTNRIVISGHTHRFSDADTNGAPYFNTGSCLVPNIVTGIEIVCNQINPIKWSLYKPFHGGVPRVKRELISKPQELISFA